MHKCLWNGLGGNPMTLNEMIFKRKSCRQFTGKPVDAEMIAKILSFDLYYFLIKQPIKRGAHML